MPMSMQVIYHKYLNEENEEKLPYVTLLSTKKVNEMPAGIYEGNATVSWSGGYTETE